MMAIDSKGNIYVGETVGGNRIQKIITKTLPRPAHRNSAAALVNVEMNRHRRIS